MKTSSKNPNRSSDSVSKVRKNSQLSVCSDDQGFETDLEDDLEKLHIEKERKKFIKTTAERYFEACESLNAVPVAKFLRQCQTGLVDLKHYGIQDIGVQVIAMALEQDITVTSLCLCDNGIGDLGSIALSRMLKDNCFVTHLDISANKIGKKGAIAIGCMLIENASLQELNLSGCGIQGKDFKHFLNALSSNPHLRRLDFGYNDLGEEGAIYLGRSLAKNRKLELLDISWNNIRASGIEEMARGLETNEKLKELNLSCNCFSDDGASHLGTALIRNHYLKVLEMQSCGIHIDGAFEIADALKKNNTLEVLRIGKNSFQSFGACLLLRGLRYNQTSALRELILDDVAFDRECENELEALLEERPNFNCSWDVSIKGGHVGKAGIKTKKPDAVELFQTFVRTRGLRLIDLFRFLAKDVNATYLTKTQFINGLKKLNVPLKDHQLRALFSSLDVNGDDEVQFHELLSSRSHYLKTTRK